MVDVIKIANERRERLAAELTKLEDFIRMAEALVEWNQSKTDRKPDVEDEMTAESEGSATLHRYSETVGSSAKN